MVGKFLFLYKLRIGLSTHFNCKQKENHDFSFYLILDRIADIKNDKLGVWNRDVLGGFFQKINKRRKRLFGAQEYSVPTMYNIGYLQ